MSSTQPQHPALPARDGSADPWAWLEDVTGTDALAWVKERNARAEAELDADGDVTELAAELKAILDSPGSIPGVVKRGEHLYNFWTDAEHPRGLWRRTSLESYRTAEPDWEVLIDVDALNAAEQQDWVWHGATVLRPSEGQPWRHALIALSHGGSDADVTREFDLVTRQFVALTDGGFERPEAKGALSWIDRDTVFLTTDLGPDSVSTSGYPLQVRRWRRGTPMADAELLYQAEPTDTLVGAGRDHTPGFVRDWISRLIDFFDSQLLLLGDDDSLIPVDVPLDCQADPHRDLLLLTPRTDWAVDGMVVPAGALAVAPLAGFLPGWEGDGPRVTVLFAPTDTVSLSDYFATVNFIVVTGQEHVRHFLEVYWQADGVWQSRRIYEDLPGSLDGAAVDHTVSDEIWISATGFLQPTTLYLGDLAPILTGKDPADLVAMKAEPSHFDATGLQVTQHFAISTDGTRVPYFQVSRADLPEAEDNPTLLYGYGGFEISLAPDYSPLVGKAWLERGGTYVVANIRGGGEYGPGWHQAALKENRHRAYEDFQAVAEDLLSRGVTTRERLACRGGSNGGLLIGNMLVRCPGLFGAVVIQVPLLDMRRYTQLLAGASWIAEYGDPATEDWEFIRGFSPYHLLDETVDYPATLVTTSTRDDRVHPGHARKMTAALEGLGANVRYWENIEGGHGGAADNAQAAKMNALIWTFLHQTIGG
ncbi:MAG: prolyl oligopeptidase family serine peptidase [Propionibacteriaceae bacterium]|nr:prolyl oligopeptidase family serine peptidase [Propionibacteriaceae bacterium]